MSMYTEKSDPTGHIILQGQPVCGGCGGGPLDFLRKRAPKLLFSLLKRKALKCPSSSTWQTGRQEPSSRVHHADESASGGG